MQLQRFPLIILAFAIGGCSVPNDAELEQERTTSADAAIRRLPGDDWCKAEAARDIEAKLKLFTADAVLMPPAESNVIGQQAIRAWHEKEWQRTKYQCSATVEEVQVFGDWGMVRGTFSGVFTPASGAPQRSSGKFLNTVRRQADGSWKIARAIWNSNQRDVGESDQKTLYQRLGGYDVVAAILDNTGPRVINDPELSKFFTETDEEMGKRGRQLAVDLLCELTGGPCFYTGPDMKMIHKGLGITDEHWQFFLGHLGETLDELNMDSEEKTDVIAVFAGLKGDIVEQQEE